jgi:hypothetical protein
MDRTPKRIHSRGVPTDLDSFLPRSITASLACPFVLVPYASIRLAIPISQPGKRGQQPGSSGHGRRPLNTYSV